MKHFRDSVATFLRDPIMQGLALFITIEIALIQNSSWLPVTIGATILFGLFLVYAPYVSDFTARLRNKLRHWSWFQKLLIGVGLILLWFAFPRVVNSPEPTVIDSQSNIAFVRNENMDLPPKFISGKIVYALNDMPVPMVRLHLEGPTSDVQFSDSSGAYTFTVYSPGVYSVRLDKQRDTRSAISGTDAYWMLESAVGSRTLNRHQAIVGDVTKNGEVTEHDSLMVLTYIADEQQEEGSQVGEWLFLPQGRVHTVESTDLTNQDYLAYMYGDVTGDWGRVLPSKEELILHLSPPTQARDQMFTLDADVGVVDEFHITDYQIVANFDPEILQFVAVVKEDTLSADWHVIVDDMQRGSISVIAYGPNPLEGVGPLLRLQFQYLDGPSTATDVCITVLESSSTSYAGAPVCRTVAS